MFRSKRRSQALAHSLCEMLEQRLALTTYTVTTTADVVDANDGELSIREAIVAANSNVAFSDAPAGNEGDPIGPDGIDRIEFAAALDGQTITLDFALTITDEIEIDGSAGGNGVTLTPAANGRSLIRVRGIDNVTLTNLTLTGANVNYRGGALRIEEEAEVTMSDSTFTNNSAFDGGAVIILAGGRLESENLTFTNNAAIASGVPNRVDGWGGAIYVGTDAEFRSSRESRFTGNRATAIGGAIAVANRGRVQLTDANIFEQNSAHGGGAIAAGFTGGSVSVGGGRNEFNNNTANFGGAVYAARNTELRMNGTSLTGNTATMRNGQFGNGGAIFLGSDTDVFLGSVDQIENRAENLGGAVYGTNRSQARLTGGSYSRNEARSGGAVWFGPRSDLAIGNSVFMTENRTVGTTRQDGGAVYMDEFSTLAVTGAAFNSNLARQSGGAFYLNNNVTATIEDATFGTNNAVIRGGAIAAEGQSRITIDNTSFTSNNVSATEGVQRIDTGPVSARNGGAISVVGNGTRIDTPDSTFERNVADGNGGAISIRGNSSSLGAFESDFERNRAGLNGGAIDVANTTGVTINGATFRENSATRIGGAFGDGGAISLGTSNVEWGYFAEPQATAQLESVNFFENSAENRGGAIYGTDRGRRRFGREYTELQVVDATFSQNRAGSGGAIHTEFTTLDTDETTFSDNHARESGGAIFGRYGYVTVKNTNFLRNEAGFRGGAIAIAGSYGSELHSINSSFIANDTSATTGGLRIGSGSISDRNGGAISNTSSGHTEITGSLFERNVTDGVGGAISSVGGTLTASSADFDRNTAGVDGGAIAGRTTIIYFANGGRLTGNRALSGAGGAIYTWGAGDPTDRRYGDSLGLVGGTIFEGNSAATRGGAIAASNVDFYAVDARFGRSTSGFGNQATNPDSQGGAICLEDSPGRLTRTTIGTGNTAAFGGGVFLTEDFVGVSTTMEVNGGAITGNTATVNGGGIFTENGATFTLNDGARVTGNTPNDTV